MGILFILIGVFFAACLLYLGLAALFRGHYWLFGIGFMLPALWVVGVMLGPTRRAAARIDNKP